MLPTPATTRLSIKTSLMAALNGWPARNARFIESMASGSCSSNFSMRFLRSLVILKKGAPTPTTMQPGTANNDVNAIRSSSALPGNYMVYHYLTDTDAWFIKTSVDGLITFNSWTMEFGRDEEFDNSNIKFKAEERFSVGWDDAKCIIGSSGI